MEKQRERNMDQLSLVCALTGDWTHNPGMCPDQNQTGDPSVYGMMPHQLIHPGQGFSEAFDVYVIIQPSTGTN